MTLTELIAEVYGITNRPDLVALTLSAIKSAALKAHRTDYYYKDIYETGITFDTSAYQQYIEYRTLIPRWRSLKYLRKFDATATPAPGVAGKFFDIILPETTQDDYFINREDVCYVAGEVIQIRSCTEIQYALLGCYLNPAIGGTDDTFISWIALDHPWAIIHEAARQVLQSIGNREEAQLQAASRDEEYRELTTSNLIAQGY